MRAINLLPKQAVGQPNAGLGAKLALVGSAAVPVIAVIIVFVGYSSAHSTVTARQAQLAALNVEIAAATKPVTVVSSAPPSLDTSSLVAERTARLAALQSVLDNDIAWDTTLQDVARVLPANAWLTTLTAISPTPADAVALPPPPPTTSTTTTTTTTAGTPAPAPAPVAVTAPNVTIAGATYTQEDVANVLSRLELLPTFTNIVLLSTGQTIVGGKTLVQFNITASLQLPPEPAQP